MKKILAVILTMVSLVLLFGCKVGPSSNEENQHGGSQSDAFPSGSSLQVVFNGEWETQLRTDVFSALVYGLELNPKFVDDTTSKSEIEIVIGKTNRAISDTAYKKLNRIEKENDSDVAYLIYVEGNSIAMAYDDDKHGINAALISNINYFVEFVVPALQEGTLADGVIYKGALDPIAYQKELDQKERDQQWQWLEVAAGKEVVDATRQYYALYSDSLLSWLADLYDPVTGAFYYSNSGRNTEGYLPDIEATFHALSMIESSGMIDHLGANFKNLPEWFLKKMAIWVKDMQDPNGYFYHPQWGKELTDTKPNRRGRDLSYGSAIMQAGGLTPTYDTPSGWRGDYTLSDGTKVDKYGNSIVSPTSAITAKLSVGVVKAVSKIVPTAGAYSAHLQSAASLKAYLDTLDIRNDSYSVGNMLSNQVGEIKQRDKELGGSLIPIIEQWLYKNQNPKNGMWEWRSDSDPSYSDYDGVDGILKLLTVFNGLGIEYPNPIPATESIVKSIYTEDAPPSVCQPYNAWYAMEDLFKNLRAHSKNLSETNRVISEIVARLRADAPNLIKHTADKVAIFIKQDSSSSFAPTQSSATSQGMRVAVPQTNEGDTNATLINTFGTLNHMFNVLGWSEPSMFGKGDYYLFMDRIENLGEIIKDEEPPLEPIDFESDTLNQTPGTVSLEKCNSSGDKVVIEDPTGSSKGNVFKFESTPDGHDSLFLPCQNANLTASCYIFESDLYFSTEQEGYFSRIYIDTSYTIGIVIYDGVIHFIDTTSTGTNRFEQDLGFTAKLEEWFNLRIEYYAGDVETVRMKIYLNGECVAVSDSFNDEGYGVPRPFYAQAKIEAFTSAKMTVLLDNLLVNKSNAVYKEESDPDGKLHVNVDHADREEILYDFEDLEAGSNYPDGWTVTGDSSAVTVKDDGENKALSVSGSTSSIVHIPFNLRTNTANAFKFETDITVNSVADGSKIEIMFRDKGVMKTEIMRFWLVPETENGETYLALYEASGGIVGLRLNVKIPIGETVKFRIDYYEDKTAALIYLDGTLLASSSAVEAYAKRGGAGKVEINNLGTGAVDITLDNVTAEKYDSSFDNAIKPQIDSITHGFENGIPEGGKLNGAVIADGVGGNKVVSFKNGGTLTLPINERSVFTGAFILNATINVPKSAPHGSDLTIRISDAKGQIILAYIIKVNNGSAQIYEVTKNKTYDTPIASFNLGNDVSLAIEYYKKQDVAQIFVDGICVAVTSITFFEGSGQLDAAEISFVSAAGGSITLDNVIAESYNKFFVHQVADGPNVDDTNTTIKFEGSTTGNLPKQFSSDLRSASAAIRIKEMMRDKTATKVLAFESSAGAQDKLYLSALSTAASGTATVFETDIYLDYNSTTTNYEIYLTNGSNAHSYLFLLYLSNGKLTIGDVTGASSSSVPGRIFGTTKSFDIGEGEWFNLRMVYYAGDHNTVRIKTYINDKLAYVSCGYYGRSTTTYGTQPKGNIDRVLIQSYGALVGTMYLDDMSLTYENIALTNDPLTYIPKEAEPNLPNDEDGAETLTFESSGPGNLPDAITRELSSVGGALTVVDSLRGGVKTKAMAFTTTKETGDKLYIAKTKTLSGYNAIRFTTELKLENLNAGGSLYIYFRNGTTVLNRINLTIGADGQIGFSDYYNSTYSFSDSLGKTGISALDWQTLTFTQYSYNGFSRLVLEFGDFKIVSTNSSWSSLTPDKITSLRIDTSSTSDMTVLFDNVSLAEAIIEIPDEHEHTYSSEWSSDELKHWRSASCSENSECTQAKTDYADHSYGDDGFCVCGVKKPEEIVSTNLGYFETLGGFDYEDATDHWAWSSKNTAKIIRKSSWTSGDQFAGGVPNATVSYLNFYNLGDDRIAELGKGTGNSNPSEVYFVKQGGGGNTLVFETYIRLSASAALASSDDKTFLTLGFINEATNAATGYGEIAIVGISGEEAVSSYMLFDTALTADVWYNLAIELNTETGVATYYIDAQVVGTVQATDIPADLGYLRVTLSGKAKADNVKFNDTYFGFVEKP